MGMIKVTKSITRTFDSTLFRPMRIGEIAIIGSSMRVKNEFIKIVCDEVVAQGESLIFGRLQINNQLVIHLYGLDYSEREIKPSWDLVSQKLLGYVVLFKWDNSHSFAEVKDTVDALTSRYKIPLVVAANIENNASNIPMQLLNVDFNLADSSEFTFYSLSDPNSVKNVLITLLDTVIDKIS